MTTGIGRANPNGTGVHRGFITNINPPMGLATDGTLIYWIDSTAGTIGRAKLDSTGVNPTFITAVGFPESIAVDGRSLYWTYNTPVVPEPSTGALVRGRLLGLAEIRRRSGLSS